MADDQARAEAAFEASLDEEFDRITALTEAELDAELRAQGFTPAEEAARVKAIVMDAIARHHAKTR